MDLLKPSAGQKTLEKQGQEHFSKSIFAFYKNVATRAAIYRSLRALRSQNRKKVSKRVFLGQKRPQKYPEKSKKIHSKVQFLCLFFDFFGYFRGLFLQTPPNRLFLRLYCDFGPGWPGDSCEWRLGSQQKRPFF